MLHLTYHPSNDDDERSTLLGVKAVRTMILALAIPLAPFLTPFAAVRLYFEKRRCLRRIRAIDDEVARAAQSVLVCHHCKRIAPVGSTTNGLSIQSFGQWPCPYCGQPWRTRWSWP